MLYWIETRGRGDDKWMRRGTIVAVSSAKAQSKARKQLKLSASVQVRAMSRGFSAESVSAEYNGKLKIHDDWTIKTELRPHTHHAIANKAEPGLIHRK